MAIDRYPPYAGSGARSGWTALSTRAKTAIPARMFSGLKYANDKRK